MGVIGIEEIFLDVKDLAKAVDFYHDLLGIPVARRDAERAYLQCERSHVVLQVKGHSGRHRGGGPMHFSFTVTEDAFDEIAGRVVGPQFFTRGPMGKRGEGRTLFMIDPDGNETEVNTRYLYGIPKR
ncbi:MAG: glyoxalase superfamily protein [Gammaproteobacteria bacterium]|nr:glyoxalase superfamily protein [Gammaproteobacteria bacterium]